MEKITAPFAWLTNEEEVARIFQQKLPEAWIQGRAMDRCAILDSRLKLYQKPSSWRKTTISIAYELMLSKNCHADLAPEFAAEIVYVQAFLYGRSYSAWDQIMSNHGKLGVNTLTACHLTEEDLIVWRFPADLVMKHLGELFEGVSREGYMPWEQLPEAISYPWKTLTTVLKYRPGVRCTTRVDIISAETGSRTSATQTHSVIAKTFAHNAGAQIFAQMRYFFQLPSGALRLPEPLAYSQSIKTLWLAFVDGVPLRNAFDESTSHLYIPQIANALSVIHDSNVTELIRFPQPDVIVIPALLIELEKKVSKLSRACPSCVQILTALNLRMALMAEVLPDTAPKFIHGDCHIEQFLVLDEKVYMLDFDSLALGDPEQDLAEFIIGLHFYGYAAEQVRSVASQLVQIYQEATSRAIDCQRFTWHATYEYINRAYRLYQEQRPGWLQQLEECLLGAGMVEDLTNMEHL